MGRRRRGPAVAWTADVAAREDMREPPRRRAPAVAPLYASRVGQSSAKVCDAGNLTARSLRTVTVLVDLRSALNGVLNRLVTVRLTGCGVLRTAYFGRAGYGSPAAPTWSGHPSNPPGETCVLDSPPFRPWPFCH